MNDRLTPANLQTDLMAITRMVSDVFADGRYIEEISQHYIGNCHYDEATTRLIWDGETLAHHWGVWGYAMRLESALLKVAGIGAVATLSEYRKQGLMQSAALDSFSAMYANGYDLSILRGRHYVKFGYVRAWNYVTYRLKPEEIPAQSPAWPYRPLGQGDLEAISTLYNRTHAAFTGTALRPTYRRMTGEDDHTYYGWFEPDGELAGYVRAIPSDDKKSLQCLEAAGDPGQCLAVLGELFRQGTYERLAFFSLPQTHPLLKTLRRGACVVEEQYFANTGWRVRLVNLHSTLEKIRPLLIARLERSQFAGWSGGLRLDAGEQAANLLIDSGAVQIVPAAPAGHALYAGPALARFLIGSDDPLEIATQENVRADGLGLELAAVLFPNLHPMLGHWDEF